jgi:cytidyltransferase-like protein
MRDKISKGMVFGVFDNLHKGHTYFLSQAKSKCDELVVVVTLSEVVERMKKKVPRKTFDERVLEIRAFDPTITVVAGDYASGDWNVLRLHKPDAVFLGYDQQGIAREMERLGIAHHFVDSYYPEKYKSSLLGDSPLG